MQLLIWDEDLLKHGNDKINHIMKVSKNAEDEVRALRPPTRPAAAPAPLPSCSRAHIRPYSPFRAQLRLLIVKMEDKNIHLSNVVGNSAEEHVRRAGSRVAAARPHLLVIPLRPARTLLTPLRGPAGDQRAAAQHGPGGAPDLP